MPGFCASAFIFLKIFFLESTIILSFNEDRLTKILLSENDLFSPNNLIRDFYLSREIRFLFYWVLTSMNGMWKFMFQSSRFQ